MGIDGSPGSRAALRWALGTDPALGAVTPVAAWHLPWWAATLAGAAVPVRYLQMENDIDAMLDEVTAEMASDRLADRIVAHGGAPTVLLEAAADKALLVVGTRGHGALLDTVLGSVAIACSLRTPVPMAVVPEPGEHTGGRCIVGIDGSQNARAALRWAMVHAPPGSEIVAIHAWNPMITMGLDQMDGVDAELSRRSEEMVRSEVEQACAELPEAPVPTPLSACGDARTVLEDESEGAEMLIVGARGDGGVTNVVLGSVTTALLHRPVCPTVVIPAAPGDAAG